MTITLSRHFYMCEQNKCSFEILQLIYFCKHFVKMCDNFGKRRGSAACRPPKKRTKEFDISTAADVNCSGTGGPILPCVINYVISLYK